jgi:hypothetical protein
MMTDFEDRTPAPPLSFGEWSLLLVVGGLMVIGYAQMAWNLVAWIGSFFA